MRKPMTTLPRFKRGHNEVDKMLKAYMLTKRGKRLSNEAQTALSDYASMWLKATNATARIVVAATADWKLKEVFSSNALTEIFWVTVTPAALAEAAHAAPFLRSEDVRGQVACLFEGIDYFGMIDVAYFPKRRNTIVGHEKRFYLAGPLVSFHVHLLAWNCRKADIEKLQSEFNAHTRSLFPKRIAFHFKQVSPERAVGKNFYQLKAPVSSYTAWADLKKVEHRKSGKVTRELSADWVVRKRSIRPGEAADIHNILSRFTIEELMLGGGQGLQLKREVISIARGRLQFRYFSNLMLTKMKITSMGAIESAPLKMASRRRGHNLTY